MNPLPIWEPSAERIELAQQRTQGVERFLDEREAEVLDRGEVPVERGRDDADLLGHLAQRQGHQGRVLGECERRVEDRAAGALLLLEA